MKKIELPAQIDYYIKHIEHSSTPIHIKKEYLHIISDYYYEMEKTLKKYQLELFDYKNRIE